MHLTFRRVVPTLGAAALLGLGFLVGQNWSAPLAAQPPNKGVVPAAGTTTAPAGDKRVIAYVYGSTPITREEFGDYLIQQFGRDRVRLYVNRRIIDMAAARKNIVVTPQEIDAIIESDCGKMGVNKKQFIDTVLPQKYGMTLNEWREDVIKPRLILQAMCRELIKVDEDNLKKIYENLYGEKVQCQIILWPPEHEQQALRSYDTIRKDKDAFDETARSQLNSALAARLGLVDPIGRHSGPATAKIEEIAFKLKDGQLSELVTTPGGIMVIKRIRSIPAKANVKYEDVRESLIKEYTDRQMELEIPKMFKKLNEEAKPQFILTPKDETEAELLEKSKKLGADPGKLDKK